MATILIVEDRTIDRKLLLTVLQSAGHDILQASDGEEALRTLANHIPDLVISDILLPSIDGYEVVRRMRERPVLAAIPVIFYTATYHEREARALADRCGVFDILPKPSPHKTILDTVSAALGSRPLTAGATGDRASFDQQHLRLVGSTLADRIDRFDAERQQMAAIVEAAQQILAERDAQALLRRLCVEARQLTLAQHAITGVLDEGGSAVRELFTSGVTAAAPLQLPSLAGSVIGEVIAERRAVRRRNPEGRPETLGLPSDHPAVSSLLSVPVASSSRVYGWLSLRNKLGTDEFTEADERAALVLGAHAGIAYESARLLDDTRRRATAFEKELTHAAARARSVREEERARLSRDLHDRLGQALTGLKMQLHRLGEQLASPDAQVEHLSDHVGGMLHVVDETIQTVRTIANELRPSVLDKLGLIAAIEWQAETFQRRTGIECRVATRIARVALDQGRATSVFRVVEEALANVFQHGHATRVKVSVTRRANWLKIMIADNGRGISSNAIADAGSLGLTGMRERAALLGGSLDIQRRRAGGTLVVLAVPIGERRQRPRTIS
jgi:signal transduction histidine kinase/DNA-binding response OmpR family regulator